MTDAFRAPEQFEVLLRDHVKPALKSLGFGRRRGSFYLFDHGNWAVVNFQRSSSSTAQRIRFTVNVGVASQRLSGLAPAEWRRKPPPEWKCDWRERLGFYRDEPVDTWWFLDEETDVAALAGEVLTLLVERAIPQMKTRMSDEVLRDYWLAAPEYHSSHALRRKLVKLMEALGDDPSRLPPVEENTEERARLHHIVKQAFREAGFVEVPETSEMVLPGVGSINFVDPDQQ